LKARRAQPDTGDQTSPVHHLSLQPDAGSSLSSPTPVPLSGAPSLSSPVANPIEGTEVQHNPTPETTEVQPSLTPETRPLRCTISLSSPTPVPLSGAPSLSSLAMKKKILVRSSRQNFLKIFHFKSVFNASKLISNTLKFIFGFQN
jgi:hypothetical protein